MKKLLRDFAKVRFRAGEWKRIRLSVKAADLAWYNPEGSRWEVEAMEYGLRIGPSSRSPELLQATFRMRESRR